jgi:N-acetylneuraminic acid mutarotase
VTDAGGNSVAGVAVTFAVQSGGGALSGATQVTNADGIASVGSWTLGPVAGANTLMAAAAGLTGRSVVFTATGTAGNASRLTLTTAPSPSAQSGVALAQQPVLRVEDAQGNPVSQAGVVVSATLVAGSGTLSGATATTDANGVATFTSLTIAAAVGTYQLVFNAPSHSSATSGPIVLSAGSANRIVVTSQPSAAATSGTVLARQPVVQLQDAVGNTVRQAGVGITAIIATGSGTLSGVTTVNTDAEGTAAFTNLTVNGLIGTYVLGFGAPGFSAVNSSFIALTAGAAASVAIEAGEGQTSPPGTALPIRPAVKVTDASGNPVNGVTVTFAVGAGGGSVTGATTSTNAAGIATLGGWTLGPISGPNTLMATLAPQGVSITLHATAQGDFWVTKASQPTSPYPAYYQAVAAVGGIIYAAGGLVSSGPVTDLRAYDPATNSWTTKASMPTPRYGAVAVAMGGLLYVVGGSNATGGSMSTTEVYNPATDSWTTLAPTWYPHAAAAAAAIGGTLYVVGRAGDDNRPAGGELEAYDPATNTWTLKANMPTARWGAAAGVIDGLMYVVGGANGRSGVIGESAAVEVYNPATDQWSARAPMSEARNRLGAGVINGVLYAVGGEVGGPGVTTHEAYNPVTNQWSPRAALPTARRGTVAAVVGYRLYVIGGAPGASDNEAYQP